MLSVADWLQTEDFKRAGMDPELFRLFRHYLNGGTDETFEALRKQQRADGASVPPDVAEDEGG